MVRVGLDSGGAAQLTFADAAQHEVEPETLTTPVRPNPHGVQHNPLVADVIQRGDADHLAVVCRRKPPRVRFVADIHRVSSRRLAEMLDGGKGNLADHGRHA